MQKNTTDAAEASGDLTKAIEEEASDRRKATKKAIVGAGFDLLSSVLGGLISVVGDVIGAAVSFGKSLMDDEVTLSSFADNLAKASSQIPILGGLLGGLFSILGSFAKYMEGTRDAITSMGESGAAFNDDMNGARSAAKAAGVSLEKFSAVVKENAQSLAVFGTVTAGAKALGEASKLVRGRLMGMGMSIDQINSELPAAMELFAVGARGQNKSVDDLAGSASSLMTEMDAMSRLTGKTRKEQMDALKKQQNSAAFQYKLANMSKTQQEQINKEMARMQAQFGDAGAELVKARVLGITPMTEEARMMMATMPEAANNINGLTDQIMSSRDGIADFDKQLNQTTVQSVKSAIASGKSLEGVLKAAAVGGGPQAQAVAKNFDVLLQNQKKYLKEGGEINEALLLEDLEKVTKQQASTDKGLESINKFEEAMRTLKEGIFTNIVQPILNSGIFTRVSNIFQGLVQQISAFVQSGKMEKLINDVVAMVESIVTQIPWVIDNVLKPAFVFAADLVTKFVQNFPEYLPKIQAFVETLVSAGTFIMDHFDTIVKVVGGLLLAFVVLKGIILVQQGLEALKNLGIITTLPSLGAMAAGMWAAVAPLLPWVLAITAAAAAVWLLWKGFKWLNEMMDKSGVTWGDVFAEIGDTIQSWVFKYLGMWVWLFKAIADKIGNIPGFGWVKELGNGAQQFIDDREKGIAESRKQRADEQSKRAQKYKDDKAKEEADQKAAEAQKNNSKAVDENTKKLEEQKKLTDIVKPSESRLGLGIQKPGGAPAGGAPAGGAVGAPAGRAPAGGAPAGGAVGAPAGGAPAGGAVGAPAGGAPAGGAPAGGAPAGGAVGAPARPVERDPDGKPSDIRKPVAKGKPDNVIVGPSADLSGVNPKLLAAFYAAAAEYGRTVTINSAYRSDEKQAELWVRGNLLGDPGVHTPAKPKKTTTITYQGKTYTVEGSGKGSRHGEGNALDMSANYQLFDPILDKYNLIRRFGAKDPPHVELKAKNGGVFDGPDSGYNVQMHGKEMVTPLNPSNLSKDMTEIARSQLGQVTGERGSADDVIAAFQQLMAAQGKSSNTGDAQNNNRAGKIVGESDGSEGMITALTRLIEIQERSLRTLKDISENI